MKLTKLEHSGLLIEQNGENLIFDPVEFEQKLPEIRDVLAIIITHKHNDHFQPAVLERLLATNPGARIFAPRDLEVDEIAGRPVEKVAAEVEWNLPEFNLKFFGQDHAAIVSGKTPCANLGVVVNDQIVNPGDSFDTPANIENIAVLCVPNAAPWLKIAESMDYIEKSRPKNVIPVHNALLSPLGEQISDNWLKTACETVGANFVGLGVGESLEI